MKEEKEMEEREEVIENEERIDIVREFYNVSVEAEWGRVVEKPEFLLTTRMMDRYIKPGDSVLDIGGGPGRYSFYLAEKGCDVTLYDLSQENVNHVMKHSFETGIAVKAICGDAREVDAVIGNIDSGNAESKQFDHVLLMGPLYHLLEEEDRIKAVDAALSLLKPGGLLFATFISMDGGLVFMLRELPEQFINPDEERFLTPLVNGENYAGSAFTQAFFINRHNLLPFMSQFGMEKLHLFGQEGVLAPNVHTFMEQSPEVKEGLLKISEKLYEKEEYLSWTEHLMYIGCKQ